ncbi:LolA family protein [Pseudokineococcus sp. 1T1Z-3]|uniref:LolA family protein n=1 Tax=Pseudokineococcus sp. 1T1Z-3 TaxID=3132745 RepID=UPI0030B064AA
MRTRSRWTLAAATTGVVVAGAVVVPGVASADPDLPPTTAQELLEDVASAQPLPFSGTVVHTSDLGLPELPQQTGSAGSDLTGLLTGSTTLRVWSDGEQRQRLSVLGDFAETSVVRDGSDVWVWRSDDRTAVHAELPSAQQLEAARGSAAEGADASPEAWGPAGGATPAEAAQRALAALDPSTEVSLDGTGTVAGRDAYELVLAPRSTTSLVGRVRLAVDAATSYPLRVQVLARRASSPALETAFTDISYAAPDDDVFAFTPPEGAEVSEAPSPGAALARRPTGGHGGTPGGGGGPSAEGSSGSDPAADRARPTVVGDGWDAVAVLRGAAGGLTDPTGSPAGGAGQALLDAAQPVSGAYGTGRVLATALVSVLALDDGRVLVGAVPPSVLEQAALDPAAAP